MAGIPLYSENRIVNLLAVALVWKIVLTIVILPLALVWGIFLGLFDVGADPETGRESNTWWQPMAAGAVIVACLWLLGCTIAPKVTQPQQPSAWATRNIEGFDRQGLKVREDWVRAYHDMLSTYGDKLPITERVPANDMSGIVRFGDIYHIDWVTNKRFTDLKRIEVEAAP